jgi:hypothetical protein
MRQVQPVHGARAGDVEHMPVNDIVIIFHCAVRHDDAVELQPFHQMRGCDDDAPAEHGAPRVEQLDADGYAADLPTFSKPSALLLVSKRFAVHCHSNHHNVVRADSPKTPHLFEPCIRSYAAADETRPNTSSPEAV